MTLSDYEKIRQELLQLQKGRSAPEGKPGIKSVDRDNGKNPVFDFGLFILLYFFLLIVITTGLLAVGVTISRYNCLIAVPAAWLALAWHRKAPLYALAVTAAGVLFFVGCSLLVSCMVDMGWDSNYYHKIDVGVLANGWNPFRSTLIDYANSSGVLPYNPNYYSYHVDTLPKISFMLGACFYAVTGSIAQAKVFNIASVVACVCLIAPMLREILRMKRVLIFLATLLTAVNAVTFPQLFLFYNDCLLFQMLTITGASFAYLYVKKNGRYAKTCKIMAFIAVCFASGIKTSALIYCAIICVGFYVHIAVALTKSDLSRKEKTKQHAAWLTYFAGMVVCALCVTGATTYISNYLNFGNPLQGVIGDDFFSNDIAMYMTPEIAALSQVQRFYVSLFSHAINTRFSEVALKIPFTFTQSDWDTTTYDTLVGGWGILFSGIFVVSILVILVVLIRLYGKKQRYFKLLLAILLYVTLLPFFVPYLWSARYYILPYWLSFTALCILFTPAIGGKDGNPSKLRKFLHTAKISMGIVLCGLLVFNLAPYLRYINNQYQFTQADRKVIRSLISQQDRYTTDIEPARRNGFYGLLFNLKDEGLDFNYTEGRQGFSGNIFLYISYFQREKGAPGEAEALSFLNRLFHSEYIIVFAGCRNCLAGLTGTELSTMRTLGLSPDTDTVDQDVYVAVLDAEGTVVFEQTGASDIDYQCVIGDDISVCAHSPADGAVSILIDGTEYARRDDGLNVVVFDPAYRQLVESVTIRAGSDPAFVQ